MPLRIRMWSMAGRVFCEITAPNKTNMPSEKSTNSLSAEVPAQSHKQLDRSLVRGVAWVAVIKWISQIVSWASALVVARILSPSDYGLVSLATVYLGLLTMIGEFGVGAAVVTLRNLTEEQVSQLNSLAVLTGIAGFLISCALAGPLASFFHFAGFRTVFIVM